MNKKLKSNAGESLAETIVAMMIVTLAMLILAGALVSAAKINKKTRNMDTSFSTAVEMTVTDDTVEIVHGNGTNVAVAVKSYTTNDKNKYQYYEDITE